MIKYLLTITALMQLISLQTKSQIQWKYSSLPGIDGTVEIHLTADLEKGWHLYSQTQPPEAIAEPTVIKFEQAPVIQLQGNTQEIGNKECYENKVLGIRNYLYKSHVDFVQTLQLKEKKKTIVNGSISYMLCNDTECIPTVVKKFSLEIY